MDIKPVQGNKATGAAAKTAPTTRPQPAAQIAPPTQTQQPSTQTTTDQATVSPEGQAQAGTTGGGTGSVQNLIEKLKSDVEAVQAEGSQDSAAKNQLSETYQSVSDQGQLSQVDSTTRQTAEKILGISTQGGTGNANANGTQGGFSNGVKSGLDKLVGARK